MPFNEPNRHARPARARPLLAASAAVALALAGSCAGAEVPAPRSRPATVAPPVEPDVAETSAHTLARYLTGEFDSLAQAQRDASYFGVKLTMCPIDAPAIGELVLYVEQALTATPDQPYRQRLYVLSAVDGSRAVSNVWQLHEPQHFVHLCDDPGRVTVSPADAFERAGCAVHLTWSDDRFAGGTLERACESALRGATYATSIIEITPTLITSWDRGYDGEGHQVWGAIDGPYHFERRSPLPTP